MTAHNLNAGPPPDGVPLGAVSAVTFVRFVAGTVLSSIFLCYGVAVTEGKVPAWLPMISDTFVFPPMSYLSRYMMAMAGFSLSLYSWTIGSYLSLFTRVRMPDGRFRVPIVNKLVAWVGIWGSLCLGWVGAVNEDENNTVHSTFAVMFFLGMIVHMGATAVVLFKHPEATTRFSAILKLVFTLVGVVQFTLFVVFNLSGHQTAVAVCEWGGVLVISAFVASAQIEFTRHGEREMWLSDLWTGPSVSPQEANAPIREPLLDVVVPR
mmetsp:Transcript_3323/g.11941  ORF Transcript_3323/g.11941 Transcript_3323/m.11941 type:complete len:265 (+) Transcript_3323:90-884(+)